MKIKLKTDYSRVNEIKAVLGKNKLHSVCKEAFCPNLNKCFNRGTLLLGTFIHDIIHFVMLATVNRLP
jgi:lipoate synthase